LPILLLQIAGRDVVAGRVTEDVRGGVFGGDPTLPTTTANSAS
jgi:hypothetical protein